MAYGQFSGYTPLEDGAYQFDTQQGPMVLFGPEAQDLAARVDASNSMAPPPGLAMGPDALAEAPTGTPTQATDAAPVRQGQTVRSGVTTLVKDPTELAKMEQQGREETAAQASAPVPLQGGSVFDPASGQEMEYVPGTAGVSKEQLEKKAGEGVKTPTSATDTVQGGFEPDQEFLQGMDESYSNQRINLELARDRQRQVSESARALYNEQLQTKAAELERAQNEEKVVREQLAKDEQIAAQAREEYGGAKIDPNRVYHGTAGTIRRIGEALAAGFGAFGAALAKTPNFALEIINKNIDDDIAAQRQEIATKKDQANNAMADLQRRGLTLSQSEALTRSMQSEHIQGQLDLLKLDASDAETNAQIDATKAALTEQQLKFKEQYRQESMGTATRTLASQIAYPRAGTAGGLRPVSVDKQLDRDAKRLANAEAARKASGGAAPGEEKPTSPAAVAELNKFNKMYVAADKAEGMVQGQEGSFWSADWGASGQAQKELDQAVLDATMEYQSGAGLGSSDADADRAAQNVAGNRSPDAIRIGMQAAKQKAVGSTISYLQSLPPDERKRAFEGLAPELQQAVQSAAKARQE